MAELGSGNGTEYPGELDTYNTTVADSVDDIKAQHMNDVNQAVVAIQNELGKDPAGSAATVVARIDAEHNANGTHAAVTATSVTSNLTDTDNIRIDGNTISSTDTAGNINLTPDTTGDLVLDGLKWPQADGSARQALRTNGSGQIEFYTPITVATPQATTSGTAVDFPGIPAGVRRIKVYLAGVSTDGTANIILQLGDSGGFETSGYSGWNHVRTAEDAWDGDGIELHTAGSLSATLTFNAMVTLDLVNTSTNGWAATYISDRSGAAPNGFWGLGSKALSSTLTQIRVTTDGADDFDAGAANITYEY